MLRTSLGRFFRAVDKFEDFAGEQVLSEAFAGICCMLREYGIDCVGRDESEQFEVADYILVRGAE